MASRSAPMPRALITHGHSDHARLGHGAVMATRQTLEIMARMSPPAARSPTAPPASADGRG